MAEEIVTIYALRDPITKEIRYVGQSRKIERRYKDHLCERDTPEKYKWIMSLRELGMAPELIILEKLKSSAPGFVFAIHERLQALKAIDAGNRLFNKPRFLHRNIDVVYDILIANNEKNRNKWNVPVSL